MGQDRSDAIFATARWLRWMVRVWCVLTTLYGFTIMTYPFISVDHCPCSPCFVAVSASSFALTNLHADDVAGFTISPIHCQVSSCRPSWQEPPFSLYLLYDNSCVLRTQRLPTQMPLVLDWAGLRSLPRRVLWGICCSRESHELVKVICTGRRW